MCNIQNEDKKGYRKYSYDECMDIIQLYLNNQIDLIYKKYPGINKSKIYGISSYYGYKKSSYFWSEEDVNWLKNNYGKISKDELLDHYKGKYSYGAIRGKAIKLGLSKPKTWSDEEDEIFCKYYSSIPIDELMKLLPNRSYNSLICRGQRYGIFSYNYLNEKYTDEQKQYIYDNFGILSDNEIADKIGKTVVGVQEQRHRMGLYIISKDYSKYENVAKFLRGHLQEWKNKSMENCNYQCIVTGSKDFVVHHIVSFNTIFAETMCLISDDGMKLSNNIDDYTKEELDKILNIFLNIHSKYPYGVCIRTDLHDLFHKTYGAGNNNEIQWKRFLENINLN